MSVEDVGKLSLYQAKLFVWKIAEVERLLEPADYSGTPSGGHLFTGGQAVRVQTVDDLRLAAKMAGVTFKES